jgi:hypothetical protein
MINHPDWCDLTRCDAVEGDEVQDFSGAHRSTRTKTVGVVWFELVQVSAPVARRTHLVFAGAGTREWAYPVEDLAPELLGLLGSAGYTSASTEDGAPVSLFDELAEGGQHGDCRELLRAGMAEKGVEVDVSATPPAVAGPYTTDGFTCPHGVTYWIEPTGEQIAAWVRDGVR